MPVCVDAIVVAVFRSVDELPSNSYRECLQCRSARRAETWIPGFEACDQENFCGYEGSYVVVIRSRFLQQDTGHSGATQSGLFIGETD